MRSILQCLLLCLVFPACQDDLCRSQPPALEVTITLAGGVKARFREIKTLHVDLSTDTTFHKKWSFQITDELDDGETSFAVALGPAGEGGFSATVLVRAKNAKGQEVAWTEKTFPANSGDACNLRTLVLGLEADGGPGTDAGDSGPDISDAGADRSPDKAKPDTIPDTPPDTASPDIASPDSMLPDTTPYDTTPLDLCPSGDFSGTKKTCKAGKCDDGLSCTVDVCIGCVCYNVVQAGHCLVGGACYKAGEADLKDTCKRCSPSTSATGWTFSTAPGCVTTLAGDGINGHINGAAASARFYEPYGVAVDSEERIYVSDHYNQKLRYILHGQVKDGSTLIVTPGGVSVGISGTVFVASALQHYIATVVNGLTGTLAGTKLAGYSPGPLAQFDRPVDVAVNNKGMVFVADYNNHVIRKIDTNNKNSVSLFAGTPKTPGHGDSDKPQVLFNHPNGVAVDNKGSVFVADKSNHVIRRIKIKDGKVSTIAGVAGQSGGPGTTNFNKPISVAVNNTGRVYVSDSGNNVIRQFQFDDSVKAVVTTLAGKGTAGFADGEAKKTAMFHTPHGLAVDALGRVHVADRLNHKVRTVHTKGYWVTIGAGTFTMGSPGFPTAEPCRDTDEEQHQVTLSNDFEIMATEVTQDQFYSVMKGYDPWHFINCGGTCPVEDVSWHEAVVYCNALSDKEKKTKCYDCKIINKQFICKEAAKYSGKGIYSCPGYRLPTEAEWEYAYRATTKTAYYSGKNNTKKCNAFSYLDKDLNADKIGIYICNSPVTYSPKHAPSQCQGPKATCWASIGPYPVGGKKANLWGLYDMAGNVQEWCHDQYGSLGSTPVTDPVGSGTTGRVIRGGAYWLPARWMRAADRSKGDPDTRHNSLGFRCARSIIKSP